MRGFSFHDLVASIIAVLLVIGISVDYIVNGEVPEGLSAALAMAMGWVFRGTVDTYQNHRESEWRRKNGTTEPVRLDEPDANARRGR